MPSVKRQNEPSPEARRRIERLLEGLKQESTAPSEHCLRWVRAVQAMEYSAAPEARPLLEGITQGTLGLQLAEQARGALRRFRDRRAFSPNASPGP